MRLDRYRKGDYTRGASVAKCAAWYIVGSPIVRSYLTPSFLKCAVLRVFGARIGIGVRIKPGVRIKFPWRLAIGNFSWLGEELWIDNLAQVSIGEHACISQRVYLCTGSHDWTKESFDLITKSITIGDHAWVAADCDVAPGVTIGEGAVLALGSVASKSLLPWSIYSGVPAVKITDRKLSEA